MVVIQIWASNVNNKLPLGRSPGQKLRFSYEFWEQIPRFKCQLYTCVCFCVCVFVSVCVRASCRHSAAGSHPWRKGGNALPPGVFWGLKREPTWNASIRAWLPQVLNSWLLSFSSIAQSCSTLCNSMDCSIPGFPVLDCLPGFAQFHVHWVSDAI